jgi:hydroxyversicolorone monooxygenase
VGEYALQVTRKIQSEYIRSLTPKQSVTDEFNKHVHEWSRHTVWSEDCNSWYKHNGTGRVTAIWPGSSLHYMALIRSPRYEDYDITYLGPGAQNMWAHLGMGVNDEVVEGRDWSPYLRSDAMDPAWLAAAKISRGVSDTNGDAKPEASLEQESPKPRL